MGEFYRRPRLGFCDVAMRDKFNDSHFDPDAVTKLLTIDQESLELFVGCLLEGATCFIFSKSKGLITVDGTKISALAITNFHAAYNIYNRTKKGMIGVCFSKNRTKRAAAAEALFEFNTKYNTPQYSKTTGQPYYFPSDIAILCIYDFPGSDQLIEIPLATDIYESNKVFISGHPFPEHSTCCKPGKTEADDIKIIEGFHNFSNQVISEGELINVCENGLLELRLSATSGMSGSPILVGEWPDCKFIGVYAGGPPLIGQYMITQAMDMLINYNYSEAVKISKTFPFDNPEIYSYSPMVNAIKRGFVELETAIFADNMPLVKDLRKCLIDYLEFGLFQTIEAYKNLEDLSFNSGISVTSLCFDKIKKIKLVFDQMDNAHFIDTDEFAMALSQA